VELTRDAGLRTITEALIARPPEYLIATTGMGMRLWFAAAREWGVEGPLLTALAATKVIARGPKTTSALRAAGIEPLWQAPSERMDDIVEYLSAIAGVGGARVALQLFDPEGHRSTAMLRAVAGELLEIPVYQWLLPVDPGPAQRLIEATITGHVAAVTFTSQPAVHSMFRLAGDGQTAPLATAFNSGRVLPACVGPVCAEAAIEEGIRTPVWPEPPRLATLVRLVTERLSPAGAG
jgi:uroporphyrinogen-III synthase